jgi:membrane-associated protein
MEPLKHALWYITTVEGLTQVIRWGGLPILVAIVFAETGLFFGFFLPGDSLLVTAGFVASTTTVLKVGLVIPALACAAVVGDHVGYVVGRKTGEALYERKETRWFKRSHLLETKAFYEKYGAATLILARFVPFARTFAPIVAGITQMPYRKFVTCSVLGGIGWVTSLTLLGFYFGKIPFVQRHIETAILLVIFVSLLPVIVSALSARAKARKRRV